MEPEKYDVINARSRGWTIRGYEPGDYYATIYCPHDRPVEVINTEGKPLDRIAVSNALGTWMKEGSIASRQNYCFH
jgi:hypothetical protein